MSDQLGVMYLGRIVESGPAASIFAAPRHPYTRLLLNALSDIEMVGRPRTPVRGGCLALSIRPPAARSPRCPLARDKCRVDKPGHTRAGDVLVACHAVAEEWE